MLFNNRSHSTTSINYTEYGHCCYEFISNYGDAVFIKTVKPVEYGSYRQFIKRDKRKNFKVNK